MKKDWGGVNRSGRAQKRKDGDPARGSVEEAPWRKEKKGLRDARGPFPVSRRKTVRKKALARGAVLYYAVQSRKEKRSLTEPSLVGRVDAKEGRGACFPL